MPVHAIMIADHSTVAHAFISGPELPPHIRATLRSQAQQEIDVTCDYCNHHLDGEPQCWSCPIIMQVVSSIRA